MRHRGYRAPRRSGFGYRPGDGNHRKRRQAGHYRQRGRTAKPGSATASSRSPVAPSGWRVAAGTGHSTPAQGCFHRHRRRPRDPATTLRGIPWGGKRAAKATHAKRALRSRCTARSGAGKAAPPHGTARAGPATASAESNRTGRAPPSAPFGDSTEARTGGTTPDTANPLRRCQGAAETTRGSTGIGTGAQAPCEGNRHGKAGTGDSHAARGEKATTNRQTADGAGSGRAKSQTRTSEAGHPHACSAPGRSLRPWHTAFDRLRERHGGTFPGKRAPDRTIGRTAEG